MTATAGAGAEAAADAVAVAATGAGVDAGAGVGTGAGAGAGAAAGGGVGGRGGAAGTTGPANRGTNSVAVSLGFHSPAAAFSLLLMCTTDALAGKIVCEQGGFDGGHPSNQEMAGTLFLGRFAQN
jgi:hypothetical protein